jgi:hypothetical protein
MGGVITLKTWKGSVIAPSMGSRAWPTVSETVTSMLAASVDTVMTAKTAVISTTHAKLQDELREAKYAHYCQGAYLHCGKSPSYSSFENRSDHKLQLSKGCGCDGAAR